MDLFKQSEIIEDDLRHPHDASFCGQAIALADDEALRAEMKQVGFALAQIETGTHGACAKCGQDICKAGSKARPIATLRANCDSYELTGSRHIRPHDIRGRPMGAKPRIISHPDIYGYWWHSGTATSNVS